MTRCTQRHDARRAVGLLALLTLVVALAGCSNVYTVEPVGTTPVVLDPDEWNGYWATPAELAGCRTGGGYDDQDSLFGCLVLTVTDASQGIVSFEPEDLSHPRALATMRQVEQGGDRTFFVTWEDWNDETPGVTRRLLWARAERDRDLLLLWLPRRETLSSLVTRGLIPGEVTTTETHGGAGDVTVGALNDSQLRFLVTDRQWDLYDWQYPMILVRAGGVSPALP